MCRSDATSANVSVPSLIDLRTTFSLPSSALCDEALGFAHSELEGPIYNHSFRVFLYADWLLHSDRATWASPALSKDPTLERELLFVACILHDVGTTEACNGPHRFEVEGGDYAATLLRKHAIDEANVQQVWLAITLHTSSGIAERAGWLPSIVRSAVLLDFVPAKRVELKALTKQSEIEHVLPRGLVERVLANAVVKQALAKPGKAPPCSWPFALLQAHMEDPRWDRDNPAF